MNAITQPAMFRRASRDMGALIAKLQAISPTELPVMPRASAIEAVQVDCREAVRAVAAFVRHRMADVEYSTGTDMGADTNADWITAAFDEWCDPRFGDAIRSTADATPPSIASRPGGHGLAP